jgi:O-antigen/teichoic acid export membrane protein
MSNSPSFSEKILKGSFTVLILSLLVSPIGYFIRAFYSHTLTIETFGLFFAVLTFFNMIATYNDLGFGATVSYFLPKYIKEKKYSQALSVYRYGQFIQVGTATFVSVIIFLLAPFLANHYFKIPGSENLIYILCIYLISTSFLNSLLQVFIGLQKERYYSSINLIRLLLTLSFSIIFWFFDLPNIVFYALSWALGYSITALIYSFLLSKKFNFLTDNKLIWDKDLFNKMYSYAIPTLITTSIASFITFSDTFFLTLIKDVREVGIYSIVLPLAAIPNMFVSPIHNLLFPLISHLVEGDKKKIGYITGRILIIVTFLSLYFALFIVMFPSTIVALIFGQKWVGLVEIPLIILSMGYIAIALYTTFGIIVAGLGEVKKRVKITLFIALLNAITSAFLVYFYGVVGVAIANSLVALLTVFLFGKIVKSSVSFNYPLTDYLKLILFSTLLYSFVTLLKFNPTTWASFILTGIIYSFIFMAFGYFIKVYDKNILRLLNSNK